MPEIAIRVNASTAWGMGHVLRQRHLAGVLREKGNAITFFISPHAPSKTLLENAGFLVHTVKADCGLPEGGGKRFDLVILDMKDTSVDFIAKLRAHAEKIVTFEDLKDGRNKADLLIDCNLKEEANASVESGVKTLFGLRYSVIAPEFAEYNSKDKTFSGGIEKLLVSMGGTDPNRLTTRLAEILLQCSPELAVTFLTGPGFEDRGTLEQTVAATPSFHIVPGADRMAELIFAHDAIFCSGGVTLHEALAAGTPAFVISQVPHQEEKALGLEEKGACVNLGLADNFDAAKIPQLLKLKKEELEELSRKGKKLIDGRGIHRVATAIEELIKGKD